MELKTATSPEASIMETTHALVEALDDLKLYFLGISAELSQRLGVDYTAMIDHSHSQT